MMSSFEETKTNARIGQHRSGYVLPLFNGYILYSMLINANHLKNDGDRIKLEFEVRGILSKFEPIVQSKVSVVTKLIKILKENEKTRFENDLNVDMERSGIIITQMKVGAKLAMLKDKIDKREEGTDPVVDWNVYEINRVRYFKKQSETYDCLDVLKT